MSNNDQRADGRASLVSVTLPRWAGPGWGCRGEILSVNQENCKVASELGDKGTPEVPWAHRTMWRAAGHRGQDPCEGGSSRPQLTLRLLAGTQQAFESPCSHTGVNVIRRLCSRGFEYK